MASLAESSIEEHKKALDKWTEEIGKKTKAIRELLGKVRSSKSTIQNDVDVVKNQELVDSFKAQLEQIRAEFNLFTGADGVEKLINALRELPQYQEGELKEYLDGFVSLLDETKEIFKTRVTTNETALEELQSEIATARTAPVLESLLALESVVVDAEAAKLANDKTETDRLIDIAEEGFTYATAIVDDLRSYSLNEGSGIEIISDRAYQAQGALDLLEVRILKLISQELPPPSAVIPSATIPLVAPGGTTPVSPTAKTQPMPASATPTQPITAVIPAAQAVVVQTQKTSRFRANIVIPAVMFVGGLVAAAVTAGVLIFGQSDTRQIAQPEPTTTIIDGTATTVTTTPTPETTTVPTTDAPALPADPVTPTTAPVAATPDVTAPPATSAPAATPATSSAPAPSSPANGGGGSSPRPRPLTPAQEAEIAARVNPIIPAGPIVTAPAPSAPPPPAPAPAPAYDPTTSPDPATVGTLPPR